MELCLNRCAHFNLAEVCPGERPRSWLIQLCLRPHDKLHEEWCSEGDMGPPQRLKHSWKVDGLLLVSCQVDAPAGKRVVFEETLHSRPVLNCVFWTLGWQS